MSENNAFALSPATGPVRIPPLGSSHRSIRTAPLYFNSVLTVPHPFIPERALTLIRSCAHIPGRPVFPRPRGLAFGFSVRPTVISSSLFFLNSTEQSIIPTCKLSIKSGLTIGFLGLGVAESVQRGIHSSLGSQKPEGWRDQISDGGEPTAKYSLSFQKAAYQRQYSNGLAQEINWTGKADLGLQVSVLV